MKWTYLIRQKLKIALALSVVFLLIFATSLIDKNHFAELSGSFSSVYKDRLLVENYIYRISNLIHYKRALVKDIERTGRYERMGEVHGVNDSVRSLLAEYDKTFLTEAESVIFARLKVDMERLFVLEEDYETSDKRAGLQSRINEYYLNIHAHLHDLSDIQVEEGKNLIDRSQRIISDSNILFRLEVGILLITGLIIQALVIASKPIESKIQQKPELN